MPLDPPAPRSRCHNVGGVAVCVRWDDPTLDGPVATTLDVLGAGDAADASSGSPLQIVLTRCDEAACVPTEARLLDESPGGVAFFGHDGTLYLQARGAVVVVDPAEGTARAALPAEDPAVFGALVYSLLFYAVTALLYPRGLRAAHAACVVRDGHGCLIVGESDSGKSTLALRLVESGWDALTDDSVLLQHAPGGVEAVPLRRDFCVDPDAEALFPRAAGHWDPHLGDPRKRRLRVRDLHPDRVALRCVPRTVLFPRIVPEPTSRLVPIGRKAVLLGLLQHTGAPAWLDAAAAAAHLRDLGALAGQVQGFDLLAGRDLRDDPAAVEALTHTLLHAAGALEAAPLAPAR